MEATTATYSFTSDQVLDTLQQLRSQEIPMKGDGRMRTDLVVLASPLLDAHALLTSSSGKQ